MVPRQPAAFRNQPNVVGYADVLSGAVTVGPRVAIVGAGGIGFDVAEFLSDPSGKQLTEAGPEPGMAPERQVREYCGEWDIDFDNTARGGLVAAKDESPPTLASSSASPSAGATAGAAATEEAVAPREVFLLQRKPGKVGAGLAKTTGWIKRLQLKRRGVQMLSGVKYEGVEPTGLRVSTKASKHSEGGSRLLEVDHIVICAGQESSRALFDQAIGGTGTAGSAGGSGNAAKWFVIGGAEQAAEVDAKRAFDQGTRLAAVIETAETGAVFNQPVAWTSKAYSFLQKILGK